MTSPTSALRLSVHPDRAAMGRAAALEIAAALRGLLDARRSVRMAFAAAPSQREMLHALASQPGIDWSRVIAFHLDEYVGLAPDAPQRFGCWLSAEFFDRVPLGRVELLRPEPDPERAAGAYAALLVEAPIDLVCLGIGVNGHLAFNDPPVADLADPADVKVVDLDEECRRQQVDDGCFAELGDVPHRALTLTVPRLLRAGRLFCVVPGAAKARAVRRALHDPIGTACPATALRTHPDCAVFLDADSASALPGEDADAT